MNKDKLVKPLLRLHDNWGFSSNNNAYGTDGVCPTLRTTGGGERIILFNSMEDNKKDWCIVKDAEGNRYRVRIRKLTPKECARFMDVRDEDAEKMLQVNSKGQCYKQYGNSIVVACMTGIFRNLFIDTMPQVKAQRVEQLTLF